MKDNVRIIHRQRGKIVDIREGHNIFLESGRAWLGRLISLITQTPDIPEDVERIKYMGLGIGGTGQLDSIGVSNPPLSTSYPAGSDPLGTTGNQYDDAFPYVDEVAFDTLERPVRIAGGTTTYPGAAGDQWLTQPGTLQFAVTHPTTTSRKFYAFFDGASGDFAYGSFTNIPLSEAGLFLSGSSATGSPFQTLVAYHTFATIGFTPTSELEFQWTVAF